MQTLFEKLWVSLLSWPTSSLDMSPIEQVWDLIDCHGPSATTLDALWTHIQTAWMEIPQEHIQPLLNPYPGTLIAAHWDFTPY